jgi:hypothetical protein
MYISDKARSERINETNSVTIFLNTQVSEGKVLPDRRYGTTGHTSKTKDCVTGIFVASSLARSDVM